LRVIEFREFFPAFRRMASRTAQLLTIRAQKFHAFLELVSMWILVASRARKIIEVVHGIGFDRWFHLG
jgi:hypothetical protein